MLKTRVIAGSIVAVLFTALAGCSTVPVDPNDTSPPTADMLVSQSGSTATPLAASAGISVGTHTSVVVWLEGTDPQGVKSLTVVTKEENTACDNNGLGPTPTLQPNMNTTFTAPPNAQNKVLTDYRASIVIYPIGDSGGLICYDSMNANGPCEEKLTMTLTAENWGSQPSPPFTTEIRYVCP
jgi:hypothetical protein